ncbi:MAG: Crp/Fnr family transcriptional regulator [Lactimicrobium sp.]|uniref:Crp/Fnr family transcriptional regulator n=1 Tax=Lactimicrobium sp. TaxID=2563780 RepID=UPI002F3543F4
MNEFLLSNTNLFHGINEDEIKHLLVCLGAHEQSYDKNETILRAGSTVQEIGLVESGSVNIIVNFYWGTSRIFGHASQGEIFAENYAAIPGKELLCDVVAAQPSTILFLNLNKLLTTCQKGCAFHNRLIHNLLSIQARKCLNMSLRMMHTAPKSLREKLLSYLSEQAMVHGSTHFSIPYDRQQLADYLGVDRSAMSAELSRMKKDGLISCHKNEFILHEMPDHL